MLDLFGEQIIDRFREPYGCFSNFSPHPVHVFGIDFATSEHAYQWAKTLIPEEKTRVLIKTVQEMNECGEVLGTYTRPTTAGEAKREGHLITRRPDWEDVRYDIMLEILRAKFRQNADARDVLLATEDAILIEGNTWHDNIWGDCRCGVKPKCAATGMNMLGKVLMQIRRELLHERGK